MLNQPPRGARSPITNLKSSAVTGPWRKTRGDDTVRSSRIGGMGRHAHRHGLRRCGDDIGDAGITARHQRQMAGPEALGQSQHHRRCPDAQQWELPRPCPQSGNGFFRSLTACEQRRALLAEERRGLAGFKSGCERSVRERRNRSALQSWRPENSSAPSRPLRCPGWRRLPTAAHRRAAGGPALAAAACE